MTTEPATTTLLLILPTRTTASPAITGLPRLGYGVLTVQDIQEAHQRLESPTGFSLAVLEVSIDAQTGQYFPASLLEKEWQIPVVWLVDSQSVHLLKQSEQNAAYGYIIKDSPAEAAAGVLDMALKLFSAQQQIQEQKTLTDLLTQSTGDVIWSMDPYSGRFKYVSPLVEQLRGFTVEEVLQQSFQEALTPASYQVVRDLIPVRLAAFAAGDESMRVMTMEVDQTHRNGSVVPTEVITTLVPGADGQVVEILGISRDIRQRRRSDNQLKKALETQKQIEAELKSERQIFINILDSTLAGYWDWDLVSNTEYLSPGFKRMFGYQDHELPNLPTTWQSLILPEDLQLTFDSFERHVRSHGEEPYYNEVRYRHKDGRTVWVMCAGNVVEWDPSGSPLRMIGCHVDITAHKQAEASLLESDRRLSKAQEIAHLGSWEMDIDNNRLIWSDETYRIFGLQPQEVESTYELFLEMVHPEDRQVVNEAYSRSVNEGRDGYEIEHRLIRKNTGEVRYVHERCEHLTDASGRIFRSLGMVQDITDRKRSEQQIQKNENLLNDMGRMAKVGGWEYNLETRELVWTDEVYRILEIDPKSYRPELETALNFYTPEYRPLVTKVMTDLMNNNIPFDQEMELVTARGRHVWAHGTGYASLENGKTTIVQGTFQDITERKQTARALERAYQEKSTLLSELQHRIKNSLNLISSLISLEQQSATQDETKRVLNELYGRVLSLADLYTILFDSKNLHRVQLDQYVERVVQSLQRSYLRDKQAIEIEMACEQIQVEARQATAFGLILNELLTNAFKYGFPGRGGGRVWVTLAQSGERVVLEVANEGFSLQPDFDLKTSANLGLQIVQMLAEQLGGSVSYQHNGKTNFRVEVLLSDA